jgi:hypothetical protein
MRMIAVWFGPYAPEALTAHVPVFSHDFQGCERWPKLAPVRGKTRRPEGRGHTPRGAPAGSWHERTALPGPCAALGGGLRGGGR